MSTEAMSSSGIRNERVEEYIGHFLSGRGWQTAE